MGYHGAPIAYVQLSPHVHLHQKRERNIYIKTLHYVCTFIYPFPLSFQNAQPFKTLEYYFLTSGPQLQHYSSESSQSSHHASTQHLLRGAGRHQRRTRRRRAYIGGDIDNRRHAPSTRNSRLRHSWQIARHRQRACRLNILRAVNRCACACDDLRQLCGFGFLRLDRVGGIGATRREAGGAWVVDLRGAVKGVRGGGCCNGLE